MPGSRRVAVLGGGFAGLETAFALRERGGERAEVTLVSRRGRFVMRPATLRVPFGATLDSAHLDIGSAAARRGILFVHATVTGLDLAAGMVETVEGRRIAYDRLVVATGAQPDWDRVPGLRERALSIGDVDDLLRMRRDLARLEQAAVAGRRSTVLFVLPPGNACPKPLYEIALATDTWLRRRRVRRLVELSFSTYERSYLNALGKLDGHVKDEFHLRGIHGNRLYALDRVEEGRALYRNGAAIAYDVLVTHPPQRPAVTYPELEVDEHGWLLADAQTRQSPGHAEILIAGDAAATDVRMAYRALIQGDSAAAALAGWLCGKVSAAPRAPLEPGASDENGLWATDSRAWRTGRQLVGAYLPRRFRRGLPFDSELGVRALSKVVV